MGKTAFRLLGLVVGFAGAGLLAGRVIAYFTQTGMFFPLYAPDSDPALAISVLLFALAAGLAVYAFLGWRQQTLAASAQVRRFAQIKALIDQERQSFAALQKVWKQKQRQWQEQKLKWQQYNEKWCKLQQTFQAERKKLIQELAELKSKFNSRKETEDAAVPAGTPPEEIERIRREAEAAWEKEREALRREKEELSASLEKLEKKIEELEKSRSEEGEKEKENEDGLRALRNELKEKEEKIRSLQESVKALEEEKKGLEETSTRFEEEKRKFEQEKTKLEEELDARTKEFEEEKKRTAEKLAEANGERLTFLSKLSEGLRAPIARIAQVARTKRETPGEALTEISQLAETFLVRVEDLLDLARLEAGTYKLVVVEVPLEKVVSRTVAKFRPEAKKREVDLLWKQAGDDLGTITVDERIVERCVGNLLQNAIKYTRRAGRVDIQARLDKSGGTPKALIEVRDTGIGIPPEKLDSVFEPFVSGVQPRSEISEEGAGLGLTLVKAFVELHGGTVTARSTPGEGSVFSLTFPAHVPAAVESPESTESVTAS